MTMFSQSNSFKMDVYEFDRNFITGHFDNGSRKANVIYSIEARQSSLYFEIVKQTYKDGQVKHFGFSESMWKAFGNKECGDTDDTILDNYDKVLINAIFKKEIIGDMANSIMARLAIKYFKYEIQRYTPQFYQYCVDTCKFNDRIA